MAFPDHPLMPTICALLAQEAAEPAPLRAALQSVIAASPDPRACLAWLQTQPFAVGQIPLPVLAALTLTD